MRPSDVTSPATPHFRSVTLQEAMLIAHGGKHVAAVLKRKPASSRSHPDDAAKN